MINYPGNLVSNLVAKTDTTIILCLGSLLCAANERNWQNVHLTYWAIEQKVVVVIHKIHAMASIWLTLAVSFHLQTLPNVKKT